MKPIRGIYKDVIESINESARSCYPQEFLCMLRAEDGIISEVLLIPGTIYGDSHGFLNVWLAPVDFNMTGSAHSHPGYSNEPSDDDLGFFGQWGGVHIITCLPFDEKSWSAYTSNGDVVHLEVIE